MVWFYRCDLARNTTEDIMIIYENSEINIDNDDEEGK